MSFEALDSPIQCPASWPLVRLKQITKKIGSGATPTGGQAAYQVSRTNFALVRSQNVFDRSFSESGLAFISDAQAKDLRNVRLEEHDLLLNITGDGVTFGRACMVPKTLLPAVVNQHVSIIRLDQNTALPGYILSYLTHPAVKEYVEAFNAGGSRRAITKSHIESFVVPLPPLGVQASIAGILSTLDDRIALLRETNATLEAIAQALFKSWFVDFDPVRAKQQGFAPSGMDEATAALFPKSFAESELGMVPKGWRIGAVSDFARLHKGSINPLNQPQTTFEHFSLPAFDAGQRPVPELGSDIKSNKTSVPAEAVLLSKLNPHIPRVWLPFDAGSNAVCSTEFLAFVPDGGASREFVYCAFKMPAFQERLCQLVTGTSNSHQRVKPDGVSRVKAIVPDAHVLDAFATVTGPLLARVGRNRLISNSLATLRDTLLPRLISGQLRLPETEYQIADVGAT